jgi:hypothetical protein
LIPKLLDLQQPSITYVIKIIRAFHTELCNAFYRILIRKGPLKSPERKVNLYEILTSHGAEDVDIGFLGFNTLCTCGGNQRFIGTPLLL